MSGIFISYRRQDSQSAAGRLADHVKEHMAGVPVFRDVETIEPGVDFVEAIDHALQSCGVLLAVIGPRWLVLDDANGKRRLDDPDDYTRLEVATALQRPNVRVIPVLVEGAQMPSGDELPPDLKPLARRNAIELTDKRWEYDVSQLIETLNKVLEIPPPPKPVPRPEPKPEPRPEPRPEPSPAPRPEPRAAGNWFQRLSPVARWSLVSVATLIVLASFYAEEEIPGTPPPRVELMPAPGATVPPTDAVDSAAAPAPAATADEGAGTPNLTGMWRDDEGGAHQIVQNGTQIQVQGLSPDGYVAGVGVMQGRSGWVEYTLNGYPLRAQVEATPDGMHLRIVVVDRSTGEQDVLTMRRVR